MSTAAYSAIFQPTREVNATRIKDVLYIFNGTYPLYYKGDGKLYLMPEHQPTFSELVVAGHNTAMDDFEDYYYSREFKQLPNTISSNETFKVRDFDLVPKIPYLNKADDDTDPQIEIKATHIYNDLYNTNFSGFFPLSYKGVVENEGAISNAPDTGLYEIYYLQDIRQFVDNANEESWEVISPTPSKGFGIYYGIGVDVFYREVAPGVTDEDWIQLDEENYSYTQISNSTISGNIQTVTGFTEIPERDFSFANTVPLYINIDNIPTGVKDVRVDFYINTKRHTLIAEDPGSQAFNSIAVFTDTKSVRQTITFDEIEITAAKLENFPVDEDGLRSRGGFGLHTLWSCNKVINHYEKLLAFGSEKDPDTIFTSTKDNLFYFPYNYSMSLETDQREKINSIVPFMNILVAQSDSYTWGIKGQSPQLYLDEAGEDINPLAYEIISINASVGSIAPKAVRPVRNRLYFLSQEGLMELTSLFATDDRYNVKPVDRNIRNLIPQDRRAVAIQFDNQYWIHFPSTGETFRYYIEKEAWVRDTVNFNEFLGIYRYYIKDGKLHFITNPVTISDGNATIYEGSIVDELVTDFGIPIKTSFLTSKMHQEYPFHWKRYKEYKLDFSVQNEYIPEDESLEVINPDFEEIEDVHSLTFSADLKKNRIYRVSFDDGLNEEGGS